jgi:YedE family putative selenium metabolism protein
MLRDEKSATRNVIGVGFALFVGGLAAWLVVAGNPGNMGICGACFLRDAAGSLGLISKPDQRIEPKLAYLRPEVVGLVIGAFAAALIGRRFVARSGSHAGSRFLLGVWMAIGALVFLGCPFRMLQRLGGGDGNALVGLLGFLTGVFAGLGFERRGYSIGKTSPAPVFVGLQAPAIVLVLLGMFLAGGVLLGPAAGAAGVPAHAFWLLSLGVAAVAGLLLSASGFCAVSAARQIFQRRWVMPIAALALIAGYAVVLLVAGKFHASFADQPVAHQDALWNFAAMALVGLTGALAGGCPVRQVVMAGEGNADALVTMAGLLVGGAVAHDLALASTPAGPTGGGKIAVIVGIVWAAIYAFGITRASARAPAA